MIAAVDADEIRVIVQMMQVDLALLKLSRVTMTEATVTQSLKDANEDSVEESVRSADARRKSAELQDVRSQAVVEMMTTVIRMMALIEVIQEERDDKTVNCSNRSPKNSNPIGLMQQIKKCNELVKMQQQPGPTCKQTNNHLVKLIKDAYLVILLSQYQSNQN